MNRIFGRLNDGITDAVARVVSTSTDTLDWRELRGLPILLDRHSALTIEKAELEARGRRLADGEIGQLDREAAAVVVKGRHAPAVNTGHEFNADRVSPYRGLPVVPMHPMGMDASRKERETIRTSLSRINAELAQLNKDIRAARFAAQDDVREPVKQLYRDPVERRRLLLEQLFAVDAELAALDEQYADVNGLQAFGRALNALKPVVTSAA